MSPSSRANREPDPVEAAIEAALQPGRFIGWRDRPSFVDSLDRIAEQLAILIGSDPVRATALHETFIAACFEKANEVDDSGGMFGEFVGSLFAGWVTARQAAGAGADETALRLLAWMGDDPYGLANDLDRHVAKVLDKAGAAAFERLVRARMTGHAPSADRAEADPEVRLRRWGAVLRRLFRTKRSLSGYVAVAEEAGVTATDCAEIARMLAMRGRSAEALEWVERGLTLEADHTHLHDLGETKRELLWKLGRDGEALALAWEQYRKNPHRYYLAELMRFVPKGERAAWHRKAMDSAEEANLGAALEIFLESKETARLVARVRKATDDEIEQAFPSSVEPVAAKLATSHPDLAARLYRALAVRILKAKKSKYYDEALSHFESARKAYEKAGLGVEWEKLVAAIRSEHRLKTGFMPEFEALLRGAGPSTRPSFLERAKSRWTRTE